MILVNSTQTSNFIYKSIKNGMTGLINIDGMENYNFIITGYHNNYIN